jgi:3D (Asp-Asp-Asp) domain-containing protein
LLATIVLWGTQGCAWLQAPAVAWQKPKPTPKITLRVSASAYNSLVEQTDDTPTLTSSGVILEPGMRVIAVSPDLLDMGLDYGTLVEIDGLPGQWRVVDRMASRWRSSIDVYMGEDRAAALVFGRRQLSIRWKPGNKGPETPIIEAEAVKADTVEAGLE